MDRGFGHFDPSSSLMKKGREGPASACVGLPSEASGAVDGNHAVEQEQSCMAPIRDLPI